MSHLTALVEEFLGARRQNNWEYAIDRVYDIIEFTYDNHADIQEKEVIRILQRLRKEK